jgi:outer membrane protein OmpA-like peptidoglycan-associated protein
MKLAAHCGNAAIPDPVRPDTYETIGGRVCPWRTGVSAFAAVSVWALLAVPAMAQQTIVIGDDKPSANSTGPERPDTAGVVINTDVLDSLGSSGTFAPPLAPSAPYATSIQTNPTQGSPLQGGTAQAGTPGTAYRLPGNGQLVISRPSTLLFPPTQFPNSRLTVPAPPGHVARAATAPDTGKAQSRLLVPEPTEPAAPQVTQPVTAPEVATAVPREPVTEALEPVPPIEQSSEPTPPPVAPIAPTAEPIAPVEPAPSAAVAALPPEPEPAAEPPTMAPLTEELQSAPPPALLPTTPSDSAPMAEPASEPEPEAAPEPMAEPEPSPETIPETALAPEPSQSAALPPAAGETVGEMRLIFNDGSAELTSEATGLLNGVAKELLSNADARVQLLAYAKASAEGPSRARRLSLSRALAVRAYLIEKGVRSTRMDVRALGSGFEDGPPDRVDILPQKSAQ